MTKGQTGQHARLDLGLQPLHHARQLKALVVRHQFVVAELRKHNGFLLYQHTCVKQLAQHALHPVRVLVDILNKQHTAFDFGQVRCSNQ